MCGCASESPLRLSKNLTLGVDARAPEIVVDSPKLDEPVKAGMLCVPAGKNEYDLWVKVRTHEKYYLHAFDDRNPNSVPLTVNLSLPPGTELSKKLSYPDAKMEHGMPIYRGDLLVHGKINAKSTSDTPLKVTVGFQACSETSCLQADSIELMQTLKPPAS